MKNKNTYFILILLLTTQVVFGFQPKSKNGKIQLSAIAPFDDTFQLTINKNIIVDVTRSDEGWIKTKNNFKDSKNQFEVEFYFDDKDLYFVRLVKPDEQMERKYEINRIKINGQGYRSVEADKKIDFSSNKKFNADETELLNQFFKKPDFKNDEQLLAYFKYLYRDISNYLAGNLGTVYIYGEAIAKTKIDHLYYRFDDEKFLPNQKIKTSSSSLNNERKNYANGYRIDFNRKELKNRQTIFFSSSMFNIKDTVLMNQNSINLVALRKNMSSSENELGLNNYLFLDQNFEEILPKAGVLNEDEKKFVGTYGIKLEHVRFQLREDKIYYKKEGDLEYIGEWKLEESSGRKKIKIYSIYTINRKVGNKSEPADVGSSFSLLINGEKLLYPTSPPAYSELEKL